MKAKDTIMSDKELSHFGADNIPMPEGGQTLFLNITLVLEKQAEISFKAGIKEVVEWLQEYAIHGGEIPLKSVLVDIETHSPFMMSQAKRMGDYTRRR